MERDTRFIPTDIESIACPHCRGIARLIRREPPPAGVGELLTFKCDKLRQGIKNNRSGLGRQVFPVLIVIGVRTGRIQLGVPR